MWGLQETWDVAQNSDAIVVSNKAKGRISKWMFLENKACQIFRNANISYPLIGTRCVCIRG